MLLCQLSVARHEGPVQGLHHREGVGTRDADVREALGQHEDGTSLGGCFLDERRASVEVGLDVVGGCHLSHRSLGFSSARRRRRRVATGVVRRHCSHRRCYSTVSCFFCCEMEVKRAMVVMMLGGGGGRGVAVESETENGGSIKQGGCRRCRQQHPRSCWLEAGERVRVRAHSRGLREVALVIIMFPAAAQFSSASPSKSVAFESYCLVSLHYDFSPRVGNFCTFSAQPSDGTIR